MQRAHGKALVLIGRNPAKNVQEKALGHGSKQKHTCLMGFLHDPQTGRGCASRLMAWARPARGETPAREGLAPPNRLILPNPIITIIN